MLEQSSQWIEQQIARKSLELEEERRVFREVQHVLEDMVYDIETCHSEQKIYLLEQEMIDLKRTVKEYEDRETQLLDERQKAYEYAAKIEEQGKQLAKKLEQNLQVVVNELIAKKVIEQELAKAQEQVAFSAQLAKELASAQREIRELHRRNSIQKLLKTQQQQQQGNRPASRQTVSVPVPVPVPVPIQSVRAVVQDTKKPVVRTDHFGRLEEELLMNIFAFLDANSVFAVSITSRPLMHRVHTMFGMVSSSSSTTSTDSTVDVNKKQHSNSFKSSICTSDSTSTTSTTRKKIVTPSSSPQLNTQQQLQQRKTLQKPSKSLSSLLLSSTPSTSTSQGSQKLSKVEMIVNSLNKNEMKLFHEMSTRVKTLEASIIQSQAEKEDLMARLQNAENVKDFLMEKVKEVEDTLGNCMEEKTKKEEQAILDREIMGFLDAKIQEYEMTLQKCAQQNEFYKNELKRIIEEHEAKTTIIQDMVKLLTEEKQDLEIQLKSQRKVLVREVKVLRAQNQNLLTEKDQCFTQLKQLKVALRHLEEFGS